LISSSMTNSRILPPGTPASPQKSWIRYLDWNLVSVITELGGDLSWVLSSFFGVYGISYPCSHYYYVGGTYW
jgi:hypothetical protein